MRNYRAFALGSTGEVMRRHDFISINDAAALEHARQYVENHDEQRLAVLLVDLRAGRNLHHHIGAVGA